MVIQLIPSIGQLLKPPALAAAALHRFLSLGEFQSLPKEPLFSFSDFRPLLVLERLLHGASPDTQFR